MSGPARDRRQDERDERDDLYVENDLVRWMRQGLNAVRPHLTKIAAVVAALLILWGYFAWRRTSEESRRAAAWNEFFSEDYDTVISKYQDTDVARYARMRVAEGAVQEGKSLLLSKRGDAIRAFEKAESQLDALVADASAPADMRRGAMFLKGMALESSGAPEKAKEQYEKVKSQYRDTPEGKQAEARVKELSKQSAIDFYRQLANYKPGDRPAAPNPVREPNLDDILRGLGGGSNPNAGVPSPPPVKEPPKSDAKSEAKTPDQKEPIPTPPAKRSPIAAPGKDLPENDKQPAKDVKGAASPAPKDAKPAPSKPAEPPKQ